MIIDVKEQILLPNKEHICNNRYERINMAAKYKALVVSGISDIQYVWKSTILEISNV